MDDAFEVVTDIAEIAQLNDQLAKRLRASLPYEERREITYPAGHHTGAVFFAAPGGTNVRAWSPHVASDKLLNFILCAKPGTTEWIEIAVQLNFPVGAYNRRMAGAFVRDRSGDVFVAHRGKLTKGKAGLPKDKVFREFAASTVQAADNGLTTRIILIAGIDDPELVDHLWDFAQEARAVATRLGEELHGSGPGRGSDKLPAGGAGNGVSSSAAGVTTGDGSDGGLPSGPEERLLKLRSYYAEHEGDTTTDGHDAGQRTVEHGAVVRALEDLLRSEGSSQKAQAIDLAIVSTFRVDLFEVKTSSRTTDVYTGGGQLLIHGECIEDLLGLTVKRYLVVPEAPKPSHSKAFSRKAGIRVVTYEKQGSGYQFKGLR